MTGLETLQPVQYVTAKEKRLAVLHIDDWEALIEWLETLEDVQIAEQTYKELEAFDGDHLMTTAILKSCSQRHSDSP